jgi:hypothetical protein
MHFVGEFLLLAFAGGCSLLLFGFNSALHLHLCIGYWCPSRTYFCINRIHFPFTFCSLFVRWDREYHLCHQMNNEMTLTIFSN